MWPRSKSARWRKVNHLSLLAIDELHGLLRADLRVTAEKRGEEASAIKAAVSAAKMSVSTGWAAMNSPSSSADMRGRKAGSRAGLSALGLAAPRQRPCLGSAGGTGPSHRITARAERGARGDHGSAEREDGSRGPDRPLSKAEGTGPAWRGLVPPPGPAREQARRKRDRARGHPAPRALLAWRVRPERSSTRRGCVPRPEMTSCPPWRARQACARSITAVPLASMSGTRRMRRMQTLGGSGYCLNASSRRLATAKKSGPETRNASTPAVGARR